MKLTHKNYQFLKLNYYLKKSSLLFFFTSFAGNSNNSLNLKQNLKKLFFNYYKIFNKTSQKTIKGSIYTYTKDLIRNITFLVTLQINWAQKRIILNIFNSILFNLFCIKLNAKLYQIAQFKKIYGFTYLTTLFISFKLAVWILKKSK